MARLIAQIIVAGSQIAVRAFARALKQELQASQEAARRLGNAQSRAEKISNVQLGLTIDEAKQILNVSKLTKEEIEERYEFMFKANDRERGGSFYLQSKVVRAKERLDRELEEAQKQSKKEKGGAAT